MPPRTLRASAQASSARPSQTPLEGRAEDASLLIPNTVAHPSGTVLARRKSDQRAGHLFRFASTPLALRLSGSALSPAREGTYYGGPRAA